MNSPYSPRKTRLAPATFNGIIIHPYFSPSTGFLSYLSEKFYEYKEISDRSGRGCDVDVLFDSRDKSVEMLKTRVALWAGKSWDDAVVDASHTGTDVVREDFVGISRGNTTYYWTILEKE